MPSTGMACDQYENEKYTTTTVKKIQESVIFLALYDYIFH